jgi:chromate reductase, NAD(P)H dehydrogenase (quinone)
MATIVGIAGSLRKGSYNAALLRAAARSMPAGSTLEQATIEGIPLYNADVEAQGIPQAVASLKDRMAAADGLLLVTPEYNNSIPGVLKNAIDWLSRPDADIARVFGGKKVALIGASPGGFGTILSQNAWLPVLKTLGTDLWAGKKLYVSRAKALFDEAGTLTDPKMAEQLTAFLTGFVAFVAGR